jgi:hypothetical protein
MPPADDPDALPAPGPPATPSGSGAAWLDGAEAVLGSLLEHGVEFLLLGPSWLIAGLNPPENPRAPGVALDLCFRQRWANCEALVRALEELGAAPVPRRPVPVHLELRSSPETLTFELAWGRVRVMPRVQGLGYFESLWAESALWFWRDLEVRTLQSELTARGLDRARPNPGML